MAVKMPYWDTTLQTVIYECFDEFCLYDTLTFVTDYQSRLIELAWLNHQNPDWQLIFDPSQGDTFGILQGSGEVNLNGLAFGPIEPFYFINDLKTGIFNWNLQATHVFYYLKTGVGVSITLNPSANYPFIQYAFATCASASEFGVFPWPPSLGETNGKVWPPPF
jgi:hypothetical protein